MPRPLCRFPPPVCYRDSSVSLTALVAEYTCDGNIDDSGDGANGTASGGFSYTTDRHGNVGSACNFDGVDARVQVSSTISAPGNTGFSIAFWAKTSMPTFDGSMIYGNFLFSFNHLVWFTIIPGATNTVYSSFPQNTWTQVVGTYDDSTQSIKIYQDGVLIQEAVKESPVGGLNLASLDFGQNAWPAATYWSGALDEVRLYGRVLSAAEVQRLYDYQD